eukprot:TRINITY_DN15865_c0_g1_i11.p1 TRINITY_DN15865_c0_g1~~TRINITY_DN15865_c0_g1_i11.p1  ORF type:complete len:373 (+),score=54.17 TRINITY_DN15865_c0_g1_i11:80-1198(+)
MLCRNLVLLVLLGETVFAGEYGLEDYPDYDDEEALSFVRNSSKLWPEGVVVYKFEANLGVYERHIVREKMDYIVSQLEPGCVTFREKVVTDEYYLKIGSAESKCSAFIGRNLVNKTSTMRLANYCFNSTGTVVHELLHALGAAHEHVRPDRNVFLDVDCSRIKTGNEKVQRTYYQQFTRKCPFSKTENTPFDVNSIMHYRKKEIAEASQDQNRPVIVMKEPFRSEFTRRGKNLLELESEPVMSAVDVVELSRNYKCSFKPDIQKRYIAYVKKITTSLVKSINDCLNDKKDVEECLMGLKVAKKYLNEWQKQSKDTEYKEVKVIYDQIEYNFGQVIKKMESDIKFEEVFEIHTDDPKCRRTKRNCCGKCKSRS